ncbi:MAG: DNA adenine methylase [Akkermansia sp.]|nr:DNA adenine methylase [Akkermansia sp.]
MGFTPTQAEDPAYLTEQIITYLGNKRALLNLIGAGVRQVLQRTGKTRLACMDAFSGSGIVARFLKQYSHTLYANDLEDYARVINACYLANATEALRAQLKETLRGVEEQIRRGWRRGFIAEQYAPQDDTCIRPGERVFYTRRNAEYIDTARQVIAELPQELQGFFLAPLLYGASVHTNTAGVFKGFYKNSDGVGQFGGSGRNAQQRILADIRLQVPVFSRFDADVHVLQTDAADAVRAAGELDLAYLDPPYNQHPYGSNYFMLNLITRYAPPRETSRVAGIPADWNRSAFNKRPAAQDALFKVIEACPAAFIMISYNSEGFVGREELLDHLGRLGRVSVMETPYNTFRGCRNLRNRDIRVSEYLFLLERN